MDKLITRTETDVMGSIEVPVDAYYGIQTVRAAINFPISNIGIHDSLNDAIIHIKIASALANMNCKVLSKEISNALVAAGKEALLGGHDDQFILNVFQAGAGTAWHMNVNEVLTNLALEKLGKEKGDYEVIDPHNHTNMSQSTNDVIPSAMRIASMWMVHDLLYEVGRLVDSLRVLAKENERVVKTARTHLQDAVPITLGEEFEAWASSLVKRVEKVQHNSLHLRFVHLGGTAVGTGVNVPAKFDTYVVKHLRKSTKLDLKIAVNKIESTQFMTDFSDLSCSVRNLAMDLNKIANDIRLMQSGPRTGLAEISVPQVEPGSSIMPGKFNPSIAEMMNMVCFQVMGNDETIKLACNAGQLDLNVMTPVIAHNLLQSIDLLTNAIHEFNHRCVKGIKAHKDVLQEYFELNPLVGTLLNPVVGYDKAADIVDEAVRTGKNVKDLVVEMGVMSRTEADRLFGSDHLVKEGR